MDFLSSLTSLSRKFLDLIFSAWGGIFVRFSISFCAFFCCCWVSEPAHYMLQVWLDEYDFGRVLFFGKFANMFALEVGADFYCLVVVVVFFVRVWSIRVSELLVKIFSKESNFKLMECSDDRWLSSSSVASDDEACLQVLFNIACFWLLPCSWRP